MTSEATDSAPGGGLSQPRHGQQLAGQLLKEYLTTGSPSTLDLAILQLQSTVDCTPDGDPDKTGCLQNLGLAYTYKHQHTGEVVYLDRAELNTRQALNLTPADDKHRPGRIQNLGCVYRERYRVENSAQDLMKAIELHEEAFHLTPSHDENRGSRLHDLCISYEFRHLSSGSLDDIDLIIRHYKEACNNTESGVPERAVYLHEIAKAYLFKYERTGSVADLEVGIQRCQQAIDATPDDHPEKARRLQCLSQGYICKYEITGSAEDLNEGIRRSQQAVDITPEHHLIRIDRLQSLGIGYATRYERTGELSDLETSLNAFQEGLDRVPDGYHQREKFLHNIGMVYMTRYDRTGDMNDLQMTIQTNENSLDLLPDGHHDRADCLCLLGSKYMRKYGRTHLLDDLDVARNYYQEAVDMTPDHDAKRSQRLVNLILVYKSRYLKTGENSDLDASRKCEDLSGSTLENYRVSARAPPIADVWGRERYRRTRNVEDLESTIRGCEEVLQLTPIGHHHRAGCLERLGGLYEHKYQRSGVIADLDSALKAYQTAIEVTPSSHHDLPDYMQKLGDGYRLRYESSAAMSDIDMAIQQCKDTLQLTKDNHPDRVDRIYSLGCVYAIRYRRTEAMADLDLAIKLFQEGCQLVSGDDPSRTRFLGALGSSYEDRSRRTKSMADADECVRLQQMALHLTPRHHPGLFSRLISVGVAYAIRFQRKLIPTDIESSLQRLQEAFDIMPDDPLLRCICQQNLAQVHEERYRAFGNSDDLEKAITHLQEALTSAPDDHPDQARRFAELGALYGEKYQKTQDEADIKAAVLQYETGLKSVAYPPRDRLRCGKALFSVHADAQRWKSAYEVVSMAMPLVALVTPRFLDNSDKQHIITEISEFAVDATAVALRAGQSSDVAIQLLELGRGTITSSLNEMRTDLSDLRQTHHDYAEKFAKLRDYLDSPKASVEVDQRYASAKMLESLIVEIRSFSGFARFLLAPTIHDIKYAARYGPIVVLNASQYGCNAIIVKEDCIQRLQLPKLQFADIRARAVTFTNPEMLEAEALEWLWDTVTSPVFDSLGFHEASPSSWPRIWWIPTGLLAKFPIHAAGYHLDVLHNTVLDRAISSYSSSIKALIHNRRLHAETGHIVRSSDVVLVGVEKTPGYRSLPFTSQEIDRLEQLCKELELNVQRPQSDRQEVLDALQGCKIFHFAGHGLCDPKDPSASSLLLADGPLTVASLFEMNLQKSRPLLAYLSACGTGQVKHEGLIDEGLHLIGACQLAGFQHVIGTLWEVDDKLSVDVAISLYGWMQKHNMDDMAVSDGLHHTSREFRDKWIHEQGVSQDTRGDKARLIPGEEAETCETDARAGKRTENVLFMGRDPVVMSKQKYTDRRIASRLKALFWVPYVHYGI